MSSTSNISLSDSPSVVVEFLKNNQSNNESFFEYDYDVALIFLSLTIIVANILVIVLFARKFQLRTKTNTLLLSLAVSDLMMGALGIPFYIACNALHTKPICASAAVIYRFIAISTISHILAITVERYISVIHPLKYFSIVTRSRIMKVIFFLWLGSLFTALIQLSWTNMKQPVYDSFEVKCNLIYNFLSVIIYFVVPVITMSVIYCRVFFAVRHQISEARKHSISGQKRSAKVHATELRAIMIFALMLTIFICFWLSWYIIALRIYISSYFQEKFAVDRVTLDVLTFLRLSTPLINPILYTFLKQDFRKALVFTIPCKSWKRQQNDNFGFEMVTLKTSCSTAIEANVSSVTSAKNLRVKVQSQEAGFKPLIKNIEEEN